MVCSTTQLTLVTCSHICINNPGIISVLSKSLGFQNNMIRNNDNSNYRALFQIINNAVNNPIQYKNIKQIKSKNTLEHVPVFKSVNDGGKR